MLTVIENKIKQASVFVSPQVCHNFSQQRQKTNLTCMWCGQKSEVSVEQFESPFRGDRTRGFILVPGRLHSLALFISSLYLVQLLPLAGVSSLLASRPHWKKNSCLGTHINTLQHVITKKSLNVFSKFMILCWASFTDILSHT